MFSQRVLTVTIASMEYPELQTDRFYAVPGLRNPPSTQTKCASGRRLTPYSLYHATDLSNSRRLNSAAFTTTLSYCLASAPLSDVLHVI